MTTVTKEIRPEQIVTKEIKDDGTENIIKERHDGQIYYRAASSEDLIKHLDENPTFLTDNKVKYRENTIWVGSIDLNKFD